MVKWISIGISALVIVVGTVIFLEDRYHKISAAEKMQEVIEGRIVQVKEEASKESLDTFKTIQQSFKSMQRDSDTNRLESLRDRKYLLEKQLLKEPNNELLEDKTDILERQIEKLEDKLCN